MLVSRAQPTTKADKGNRSRGAKKIEFTVCPSGKWKLLPGTIGKGFQCPYFIYKGVNPNTTVAYREIKVLSKMHWLQVKGERFLCIQDTDSIESL